MVRSVLSSFSPQKLHNGCLDAGDIYALFKSDPEFSELLKDVLIPPGCLSDEAGVD